MKIIKIILIIVLAAAVWSFLPVIPLYLSPDKAPASNKAEAARLAGNKGDYFEFLVTSDVHAGLIFNDSAALKVIARMNREDRFKKVPVDFVAVTGDVSFRGSAWDYGTFNKLRSMIKRPVVAAVGNHDNDKDSASVDMYNKYAGDREYSFANRNSYFIVVDNQIGDLTEEQFARIEDDLKGAASYKHRFIIMHKSPVAPYQQSWYRPELSPWSYRFMKLCEKYGVDMVFSGHEHMSKVTDLGGVKYAVAGGGGMMSLIPTCDGGYLHYLVVKVYGDYVDHEVRRVFPPLWEYLTFYMWKDIFYALKDIVM